MMDLTINFVWIGSRPLGWLECMMIYSWKMWGCRVNLFSHLPNTEAAHDLTSLGLPAKIVTLHDLPALVARGTTMNKTREVLAGWFRARMPSAWNEDAQKLTFNIADLCKSYIAATQVGIVMDLKIGPSPHIKRYVDSGIFHDSFIGMKRVNTVENQLMGSMSSDNTKRTKYGNGFNHALFDWKGDTRMPEQMISAPFTAWFPAATASNNRALGQSRFSSAEGLQGDWFDIGKYGKKAHGEKLRIHNASFVGIANEEEYGAVRVYKREDDQTNKTDMRYRTTDAQRLEAQRLAFSEMASASIGDDSPVDVTAEGMPPIPNMLEMLGKTKKP